MCCAALVSRWRHVQREPPSPRTTPLGADPADLHAVVSTSRASDLSVLLADEASRRVRVRGPADLIARAFGTTLDRGRPARAPDGTVTHRYRTGGLSVPAALDGVIVAVLGLDDRPQARAQFRIAHPIRRRHQLHAAAARRDLPVPGTAPTAPARPSRSSSSAAGSADDLDAYFGGLGHPTPDGDRGGRRRRRQPARPGPDRAPTARCCWTSRSSASLAPRRAAGRLLRAEHRRRFLDAVSEAAHATPRPAAISISWGQNEDAWTAQARTAMDQAFADAVGLGVTVTAAAGDNGSSDGATDGTDHADFPASSPHVLACGGTRLHADPATGVSTETVWNDGQQGGATGGGVSDVFDRPTWQTDVGVPGHVRAWRPRRSRQRRPADRVQGARRRPGRCHRRHQRRRTAVGGAGRPAHSGGRVRRCHRSHRPSTDTPRAAGRLAGFRDITSGDNGSFRAGAGWDACTGLGSPDGESLLTLLRGGTG